MLNENGECVSMIEKGTECTIKIKVCFHANIKDPILAYTVKDLKGTEITGTNTALEGKEIGAVQAGDVVTAVFRQKMTLQGHSICFRLDVPVMSQAHLRYTIGCMIWRSCRLYQREIPLAAWI
ncbi:hypothetical protein C823_000514 [Eubacterium plexicaudatum ASF492]|nr:hypothetical protein C823_000514 [Eubacterium plexicaudatum ASF492]